MANNAWIGGTSAVFATNANHYTGSVPVDADNYDVDGRAQNDIAGADHSSIELATFRTYQTLGKNIGTNSAGTVTPLQIGPLICDINVPVPGSTGSGPSFIGLDFTTDPVACTIFGGRRSGLNGFSAICIRGTNVSNTLVIKGSPSVGICTMAPLETGTWPSIKILEDALVSCGPGLTWTDIDVQGAGAELTLRSGGTTLNLEGGTTRTLGTGSISTVNISKGRFKPESTGTVANLNISGTGEVDCSLLPSGAFTNVTMSGPNCRINLNNGVPGSIGVPNGIQLSDGATPAQINAPADVTIYISASITDRVVAKTADYTLTAADIGRTFTNDGAAGTITFSLPPATKGLDFEFAVHAAQQLRIDPSGSETIALPSTGVQGAAGKYLVADAATETVKIKCTKTGTWSVLGYTGTWTAEP